MSPVKIIIVLVGAAAAIAAFMLARVALNENASANQQPVIIAQEVEVPEVDVLITVRSLAVGETISFNDLAWAPWPEATLNPNQLTRDARPDAIEEMSGRVVRIPIFEQEPLLPQKTVDPGKTGIMAALLSPGMRAVSLEISVESASGGFILPNDRVDVILTHELEVPTADGLEDVLQSVSILGNVRVLAIDQGSSVATGTATDVGSTATLELSPEDSELIVLAERKGSLSLVLRSLTDAALAGDVVTSRVSEFQADAPGKRRITIIRNGRAELTNASSEE